ncbi:MAG: hypothetical protein HC905_25630 [Bacteroidales bacterium]|nr:hypothetical protein [Bacteroidales bacterium]
MEGKLIRQLTQGDFDVVDFLGVNQATQTMFYSSSEPSPLQKQYMLLNSMVRTNKF